MLDRLASMAVFVKAADCGSFSAAGVILGMSSQMVGKHVSSLEARLGTPLLNRTTRRQSLTDTGQHFYERCRVILGETEAAYALAENRHAQPRGRLRISAPVGFGSCRLAPTVSDFLKLYPLIEVELSLTDRYVDLVNEGFDAVFRLGPLPETSLAVRDVGSHRQQACASPDYLDRCGAPQTPADLADHSLLAFVNWSGRPYTEWRFARDGQIHTIQVRSRFRVNDGRVLVAAAIAGHGIILQPEDVIAEALAERELVSVLADYSVPPRPIHLIHPPHAALPAKLRAFVEYVDQAFAR